MKQEDLKKITSALIDVYEGKTVKPLEFVKDIGDIIGVLIFYASKKPFEQKLLFTQIGMKLIHLGSAIKED